MKYIILALALLFSQSIYAADSVKVKKVKKEQITDTVKVKKVEKVKDADTVKVKNTKKAKDADSVKVVPPPPPAPKYVPFLLSSHDAYLSILLSPFLYRKMHLFFYYFTFFTVFAPSQGSITPLLRPYLEQGRLSTRGR